MLKATIMSLNERMNKGELFSEQSNLNDSIFKKQSPYHTASGKKVYSGYGGIMPDIFVPADTTQDTYLVQEMNEQPELFTAYVIDRLQPCLKHYNIFQMILLKQFHVSDDMFDDYILYASGTLKEMDSQRDHVLQATYKKPC